MSNASSNVLPLFGSFFGLGTTDESTEPVTTADEIYRLTISTQTTGYTWQRVYAKKSLGNSIQKLVPTYQAKLERYNKSTKKAIKTVKTFDVTRDGWYGYSQSGGQYKMINTAFESVGGKTNFVAKREYYKHSGEQALKLHQSGSEIVDAQPYPNAISIGRKEFGANSAAGVMVHIGGVYYNSFYKRYQLGGSLGCFGVISPNNKITEKPFSYENYKKLMLKGTSSNTYYQGIAKVWKESITEAPFISNKIRGMLLVLEPRTLTTRANIGKTPKSYYNQYTAKKSDKDIQIGKYSNFLTR